MADTATTLVELLKSRRAALCTVESCTGGLIAHRLTSVPGASAAFWGSLITYDNSAKIQLAGVSEELLRTHGAVSPEVARALAEGGLKHMQSGLQFASSNIRDPRILLSISVTGIAGPSGGSAEKPVGLCFLGVAGNSRKTEASEFRADPRATRAQVIEAFAAEALTRIEAALRN